MISAYRATATATVTATVLARAGLLALVFSLLACSGDDGSAGDAGAGDARGTSDAAPGASDAGALSDAEPAGPDAAPTAVRIRLDFERLPDERSFYARAVAEDASGTPLARDITLATERGQIAPTEPDGVGVRALITPDELGGRHRVSAETADGALSASREALVLAHVDERWSQPGVVDGLVNTAGWEDGPAISADGEWLLLQYLPVPLDCVLSGDSASSTCAVARGPVAGPARPRMPGAERVASDGTIDHSCPSLGLIDAPFPVAPNALYGFHRQSDGSFAEPFVIAWEGVDGCVSGFGPYLLQRAATTLVYAYDMPLDGGGNDSFSDLFAGEVTLGTDISLGRYINIDGDISEVDVLGVPLAGTTVGQQGNPHVWERGVDDWVLFHDDERDRHDLFIVQGSGNLLSATWGDAIALPAAVNSAGEDESQPFFDGETLWFRREQTLMASTYSGGPLTDEASWTSARVELDGTPLAPEIGAILAIGEPTVAARGATDELYFIFAERASDGTLNLDVGRVESRP